VHGLSCAHGVGQVDRSDPNGPLQFGANPEQPDVSYVWPAHDADAAGGPGGVDALLHTFGMVVVAQYVADAMGADARRRLAFDHPPFPATLLNQSPGHYGSFPDPGPVKKCTP